jgi:hypothetical protein
MDNLTTTEIGHALAHLRPGAAYSVNGAEIVWLDKSQTQPSAREVLAACHMCNPDKERFSSLTQEEKINLLAKRLGLVD